MMEKKKSKYHRERERSKESKLYTYIYRILNKSDEKIDYYLIYRIYSNINI